MNISHCHIQVHDMALARRFYEGVFEFQEEYVCDENKVFLRNDANFILGLDKVENPERLPDWFHLGFDAKTELKLREVFEKVRSSGFTIKQEISEQDNPINFYCIDPDGNNIEVYCMRSL